MAYSEKWLQATTPAHAVKGKMKSNSNPIFFKLTIAAALPCLTNAADNETEIEHPQPVHKCFVSYVTNGDPSNAVDNAIDGHDLVAILFQMLWNTENWNVKRDVGAKIRNDKQQKKWIFQKLKVH